MILVGTEVAARGLDIKVYTLFRPVLNVVMSIIALQYTQGSCNESENTLWCGWERESRAYCDYNPSHLGGTEVVVMDDAN